MTKEAALFSLQIIDELVKQGVTYFCLAPGSRNTPLVLAIAENPFCETFVHFDERGLAFHALGYSMGAKKACCIVTTSGSAVANLFPAIVEAFQSSIPLILLTADRPQEEIDSGSNQTINQTKIFGSFVHWHLDLTANKNHPARFLPSMISHACMLALTKGPVHLNCRFEEPLYPLDFPKKESSFSSSYSLSKQSFESYSLPKNKKGLILIGNGEKEALFPIYTLAKKRGFPIFADITSQAKTSPRPFEVIENFSWILKCHSMPKPTLVLHFGERFVSKEPFNYLKDTKAEYLHISSSEKRYDPYFLVTKRLFTTPTAFCHHLVYEEEKEKNWLNLWKEEDKNVSKILAQMQESFEDCEPIFLSTLADSIRDSSLFIGNSMPIRDADSFFHPKKPTGKIFANRGASGIDGNIATAIGLAQGMKKHLVAILGDQTALHDSNSLAQLKKAAYPVTFIIFNNYGGGIFSHLPIKRSKHLEKYFCATHSFKLEGICSSFDLPYGKREELELWLKEKKSGLIEIETNQKKNALFYQRLSSAILQKPKRQKSLAKDPFSYL